MSPHDKPLAWLHGEVRSPPFSTEARVEVGVLLRLLQQGEKLLLPHSRRMPAIGPRCHELRIPDVDVTWPLQTPKSVIDTCKARLKRYDGA